MTEDPTLADRLGFLAELRAKLRQCLDLPPAAQWAEAIKLLRDACAVLQEIEPATEQTAKIALLIGHATLILCGPEMIRAGLEGSGESPEAPG